MAPMIIATPAPLILFDMHAKAFHFPNFEIRYLRKEEIGLDIFIPNRNDTPYCMSYFCIIFRTKVIRDTLIHSSIYSVLWV